MLHAKRTRSRVRRNLSENGCYVAMGGPLIPLMPLSTCVDARKMVPGSAMSGFLLKLELVDSAVEVKRVWALGIRGEEEGEEVGESYDFARPCPCPVYGREKYDTGNSLSEMGTGRGGVSAMGEAANALSSSRSSRESSGEGVGEAFAESDATETFRTMVGCTIQVEGRLVVDPRGLDIGVRRGDGRCSSSSIMGGARARGWISGRSFARFGWTASGKESARRRGISSVPGLVLTDVVAGTSMVNAVRGSTSVDLRR